MKTLMLLALSAVVVLANPAPHHKPEDNLNRIIDLAEKCNVSLTEEFFVEDVSPMVDGGCEDKFFCKVYDILHKHAQFGKRKDEEELVRNLRVFIDTRIPNCSELRDEVPATTVRRPIPSVVNSLTICIKIRNFRRTRS